MCCSELDGGQQAEKTAGEAPVQTATGPWQGGAGDGVHGDLGRKPAATPKFSPIHNVLKPGASHALTCRVCSLNALAGASFSETGQS